MGCLRLPETWAIFHSGFAEGDPEYEMLVTEVAEAALAAGKVVCGPLRWMGVRPDFTCFQGGTEGANIRRGAEAEIEAAKGRFSAAAAPSGVGASLGGLTAACGEIVYMSDCLNAVREAAALARGMPEADRQEVRERLGRIIADNPAEADEIREVSADAGLRLEDR
jgi:hypothetical protein